jgi:hypothetical protein
MVRYKPSRGDIISIGKGYTYFNLVFSHNSFNKKYIFAHTFPISNAKSANIFHVPLKIQNEQFYILTDRLQTIDHSERSISLVDICPSDILEEALNRLKPTIF